MLMAVEKPVVAVFLLPPDRTVVVDSIEARSGADKKKLTEEEEMTYASLRYGRHSLSLLSTGEHIEERKGKGGRGLPWG